MKIQILRLTVLGLMIASLSNLVFAQSAPPASGKSHALLVGIDRYGESGVNPTLGCEDDAKETARFVESTFHFPAASIKLLLGKDATAQNIRKAFQEWLVEGTAPGDRVFFLYAGHGSQLPDDNGDEADALDETIAPYDVNPRTGANEIRDDEFEQLIRQLSRRVVVMVFDSCHSGTISRSDVSNPKRATTRYLPSPDQFRQLEPSRSDSRGLTVSNYTVTGTQSRDSKLFIDPAGVKDLSGVVIFSAAGANQIAQSIDLGNGRDRGALSWVFAEAQQGQLPTLAKLRELIPAKIKTYQEKKMLAGNQVPVIEVLSAVPLENQPLFASEEKIPEIVLVNSKSSIKVNFHTEQNKSTYRIGEKVSYQVTTNSDGFLYLLVFSQGRVATCIFPSPEDSINIVTKGTHSIPRGKYIFPIQEPVGRDVIVALVSRERLPLGEKVAYTWDEVFSRLNLSELKSAVSAAPNRGQGVKREASAPNDWQAAVLILETIR